MTKFLAYTQRELLHFLAALILGIFIGSTVLTLIASQELDRLYLENSDLRMELSNKQEQVKNLEESLKQYKTWVITDLIIEITNDVGDHIALAVKQELRDLLQNTIGREIESLDHELFYRTVDNRIIDIEGRKYRLELEALVIWEKTKLILRIVPAR